MGGALYNIHIIKTITPLQLKSPECWGFYAFGESLFTG
jgi:hypothetical protein